VLSRTGGSQVTAQDTASIAVGRLLRRADRQPVLRRPAGRPRHLAAAPRHRRRAALAAIALSLARNPSLIPDWCKVRIGSRITIANPPEAVGVDDLDLIVEGWTETLTPYGWDVTLATAARRNRGTSASTAPGRYDSATTTTAASYAAGVTTIVFSTVSPADLWSTTAEPYDVVISGEVCTVTNMAAATGIRPVLPDRHRHPRATNGISKTLPSGSEIHLARPARYAL
jgi:hypothetical protein